MSTKSTPQLEKKLYTSYHQDGILEFGIGLGLLFAGITILLGQPGLAGLAFLVYLIYKPLKEQITTPRLGFVRFTPEKEIKRNTIIQYLFTGTMLLGLLAFFMVEKAISGGGENPIANNIPLVFGIVLAIIFLVFTVVVGIRRGYLYAVSAILAFSAVNFLDYQIWEAILTLAGVILLSSLFVMFRFVRQYPVHAE